VQERHSFGDRACRFPAAVPGDDGAIESDPVVAGEVKTLAGGPPKATENIGAQISP
jgi:hypothetical protein